MANIIVQDVYLSGHLKRGLNMPYIHTFTCERCGRTCTCQFFCKSYGDSVDTAGDTCECGKCYIEAAEKRGKTGFRGCHVIYADENEPKRVKGKEILKIYQFHRPIS